MCLVIMHVLCSTWYDPKSFLWALQHDSKLLWSQRIVCPKASFYYYWVCLVFFNFSRLGEDRDGSMCCAWRGLGGKVKCLCMSANLAGYIHAAFSRGFISTLMRRDDVHSISTWSLMVVGSAGIFSAYLGKVLEWDNSLPSPVQCQADLLLIYRQFSDIDGIRSITVNIAPQMFVVLSICY